MADESSNINVLDMLEQALAAKGLKFERWQLATFYTALQVKGFVILSGISGTGKSKLAREFAGLLPDLTLERVGSSTIGVVEDEQLMLSNPTTVIEDSATIVRQIKPSMLSYGRIGFLRRDLNNFDIPTLGERFSVTAHFDNQEEEASLSRYPAGVVRGDARSGSAVSLMLRKRAKEWLQTNFSVDEAGKAQMILIEPELDGRRPIGFYLSSTLSNGGKDDNVEGLDAVQPEQLEPCGEPVEITFERYMKDKKGSHIIVPEEWYRRSVCRAVFPPPNGQSAKTSVKLWFEDGSVDNEAYLIERAINRTDRASSQQFVHEISVGQNTRPMFNGLDKSKVKSIKLQPVSSHGELVGFRLTFLDRKTYGSNIRRTERRGGRGAAKLIDDGGWVQFNVGKAEQLFSGVLQRTNRNQTLEVNLEIDGEDKPGTLRYLEGNIAIHLLTEGGAEAWLKQTFANGGQLIVEPQVDENGKLHLDADGKPRFRLRRADEQAQVVADEEGSSEVTATVAVEQAAEQGAQPFAEAVNTTIFQNYTSIPVRPDWRDSKSLLGYYNPLSGKYERPNDFLQLITLAQQDYEEYKQDYEEYKPGRAKPLAWFVILDEMNLAHVEYYFADLLSVLESGRDEQGWTREALQLSFDPKAEGSPERDRIYLPPNLYIIGTVNMDETTFAFSPKVLDRAFTLEFSTVNFGSYAYPKPNEQDSSHNDEQRSDRLLAAFTRQQQLAHNKVELAAYRHLETVRDRLQWLNEGLAHFNMQFGYRVFDEIVAFLLAAQRNETFGSSADVLDDQAFDAAILTKVLPKLRGSRAKLERPVYLLLAWCQNPDDPNPSATAEQLASQEKKNKSVSTGEAVGQYKHTYARLQRMLRDLQTDGFASFG